jgi:hypothetical protein
MLKPQLEQPFIYFLGTMVSEYHKVEKFVSHEPKVGDWALEMTSLFRVLDPGYNYINQLVKIKTVEPNGKYTGVNMKGDPVEWLNAMFYRIPQALWIPFNAAWAQAPFIAKVRIDANDFLPKDEHVHIIDVNRFPYSLCGKLLDVNSPWTDMKEGSDCKACKKKEKKNGQKN